MNDYSAFAGLIHEAYARLHDRAYLEGQPLRSSLGGAAPLSAERLHRTLIDALEWLRPLGTTSPASAEWRRYRHAQLRYLDGATPEQIARELQVSPRQARRDHAEALDEVARLLWARVIGGAARPPSLVARDLPVERPAEKGAVAPRRADWLETELSNLTATTPASPTRVDEVVAGVVSTSQRLAAANQVRVEAIVPADLPPARADRTVLRQLLLNLLSDVIVRHPESQVRIEARRSDAGLDLRVAVEDAAGATLPPELAATSERLARSLGATLKGVGGRPGEIAVVGLPIAAVPTVLLVDDNPDVALLFRRYLDGSDYQLVQARSAERAIRLAAELLPDVVVLDVMLPSRDGWEVLQALRADPRTTGLPVIICSVIPDHALAFSLGVTEFLNKPVTRQALLDALARVRGARAPLSATDTPPPPGARPAG